MKTLFELIQKYGEPDALVDHWDKNSQQFAIWGFDEIYCKNLEELDSINPIPSSQSTQQRKNLHTSINSKKRDL